MDEIKVSEQTVARRIVMRTDTWEHLGRMAEALRATRGVEVSAEDVALIALEAGLAEIRRGLEKPKIKTPKTRTRRLTRRRLRMSDDERNQLEAWLCDKRSVRARQRTIALWLGRTKKRVRLEWLRELAIRYEAYNVANFAQNMKKDGIFFKELTDADGHREGWRLSRLGHQEAKAIESIALIGV